MKRKLPVLFLLFILLSAFPCRISAVSTSAAAAILMDAKSGEVLYEKDADSQRLIASTTKIMTAIVALEMKSPDVLVPIHRAYTLVEGSSMYLKPGQVLRLETLLYGLLLSSGNDAAVAIADFCAGDVEAFVARMNYKAQQIGMSNTSFANPNGLDHEKQYSSARDMAVLAAYAMQNPTFARIASTHTVTVEGLTFTNHNRLLKSCEGCIGLKTGYTRAAGRTLVTCAVRNGRMLVAVTLNDGNDWQDHMNLYDYGFGQ